jgi:hypothetical protein
VLWSVAAVRRAMVESAEVTSCDASAVDSPLPGSDERTGERSVRARRTDEGAEQAEP